MGSCSVGGELVYCRFGFKGKCSNPDFWFKIAVVFEAFLEDV
jgi:hypothetical protein